MTKQEAEAKASQAEYLLLRLKQRLIEPPPGVSIADFLQHDGKAPLGSVPATKTARLGDLRGRFLTIHAGAHEKNTPYTAKIHFGHLSKTPCGRDMLHRIDMPGMKVGWRNWLARRLIPLRVPTMDDLSRFCCQNSDCPEHGKRGAGNLTATHRYGPERASRLLRCNACKARFSERKGTPLFGSHLPPEMAISVLHHLTEGNGVRKTGRLVGVNRETVARYGRKAGVHAKDLHDELVAVSPPDP